MPNGSRNQENTYICPHTKEMKILNRVTWLVKKVSFPPVGFARNVKLILHMEGRSNNLGQGDEFPICLPRGVRP